MLKATDLRKHFGGVAAVDGMSFEIGRGKITALIGPNGAGKSTLFNLISGTVIADSGGIQFQGREIGAENAYVRARKGISRTFQLSRPFRNLTVEEHVLLALESDDDQLFRALFGEKRRADAREWLNRVGIGELPLDRRAGDISYGQGKLLGIAMALARPHTLLLMDEPAAGVNPVIRRKLSALLSDLRANGETIFIIEHDMGFVLPLADHVIVMDRGRLLAQGTPEEVKRDPAVLGAYLGEQL